MGCLEYYPTLAQYTYITHDAQDLSISTRPRAPDQAAGGWPPDPQTPTRRQPIRSCTRSYACYRLRAESPDRQHRKGRQHASVVTPNTHRVVLQ